MAISLIRKTQLAPDIADLVQQYGTGLFSPLSLSGDLADFIQQTLAKISGVITLDGLQGVLNITGVSGISVIASTGQNGIYVAYTGLPVLPNTMYTTGNQTVSGSKNFVGNLLYSGAPVLTGVNLSSYISSGQTGAFYPAVNPSGFITGVDLTPYALARDLYSTGSVLSNNINTLSGTLVNVYATYSQLTGLSGYEASVTNLLATYDQLTGYSGFQATVDSAFATYSQLTGLSGYEASVINLATTGSTLSSLISNLSGTLTGNYVNNSKTGVFITTGQTGAFYPRTNPSGYITGIDLSNYLLKSQTGSFLSNSYQFSGDVTGISSSLVVNQIQGNPVSAQSPVNGQTLQWNGSAWVPGAVAAGGNGGGGIVYYFDFLNTSGILPTGGLSSSGNFGNSLLGINYSIGSGSATSTDLSPQGTDVLIMGFVTASGNPGSTNIAAGLWDFNIWANTNINSATQPSLKAVVNIYNPNNSTYRFLAASDYVYLYDQTTTAQYLLNVTVPQTGIAANERLYIQFFGKKNVNPTRTITLYFDSYRPSHVHTTLPSVAGNGIVKVINGVYQTPATGIFDSDVDANANIQQSKIQGLTTSLASLYPNSNPSGFITGVNLSSYTLNSQTGQFITTGQSGQFYPNSNPSGFVTSAQTGIFITTGQTGAFASSFPTGQFITTGQSGQFYPNSNPNSFISGNGSITQIISLTQAQYNSISSPSSTTLYIING
jgi:hypothetical protein